MSKLLEWLFVAALIMGPWTAVMTNLIKNDFTDSNFSAILLFPFVLIGIFGLISLSIIAFRVYSFNDCIEAEKELQLQIKEAKTDLTKKGLKFSSS